MELAIYLVAAVLLWLTCFFVGIIMDVFSTRNNKHIIFENAAIASIVMVVTGVIVLVQRLLGA